MPIVRSKRVRGFRHQKRKAKRMGAVLSEEDVTEEKKILKNIFHTCKRG